MRSKKDWSLSLSEQAALCAPWCGFFQSKNSAKYKGYYEAVFTAVCDALGMQHLSCGSHFP